MSGSTQVGYTIEWTFACSLGVRDVMQTTETECGVASCAYMISELWPCSESGVESSGYSIHEGPCVT